LDLKTKGFWIEDLGGMGGRVRLDSQAGKIRKDRKWRYKVEITTATPLTMLMPGGAIKKGAQCWGVTDEISFSALEPSPPFMM